MITCHRVSKRYGSFELKDINLKINSGEIVGIVGESGSGKSTLLKLLNLSEKPDEGSILIDQVDVTKLSKTKIRQIQHSMSMIFQDYHLLNNLTVLDNIHLPLKLLGEKDKSKAYYWLDRVGLMDHQDKYPTQLSGGQKQRVALARALVNQPTLLLLDEATSALDDHTTHLILELIQEIHEEYQPTICFVSHELDSVKYLCQRCLIMEHGKLVADVVINQSDREELTSTYKEKAIRRLES